VNCTSKRRKPIEISWIGSLFSQLNVVAQLGCPYDFLLNYSRQAENVEHDAADYDRLTDLAEKQATQSNRNENKSDF
jgi:hypothetical protein